ncbi:MAG: prolyl oligopeptidase family serine peptidase [Firmicutes bacterium]|nr:prolyl oligopeptidase family serine peptidase [Bacillota bacterium]
MPAFLKSKRRWAFRIVWCFPALLLVMTTAAARQGYQRPAKEILDVLDARPTPQISVSPSRDVVLLSEPQRYPPIAELARPMLRLAGLRISPATNGPHRSQQYSNLVLKRIAEGTEWRIQIPAEWTVGLPVWSPDGQRLAFTRTTDAAIELWVAEVSTGRARRLEGLRLNAVTTAGFQWMPDSRTLLCVLVPAGRGAPPQPPAVPDGPVVQENFGWPAPAPTYQDLLSNAHDEDLFDYYATGQLALVDSATGRVTPIGQPKIFYSVEPSPDGRHILVEHIHRPYSYLLPLARFPREIEVWDLSGRLLKSIASLPLREDVPLGGVPTGPRNVAWVPTEPAVLYWVEALDDGNPRKKVPHRDRVFWLAAPFSVAPQELFRLEHRYSGISWGERGDLVIVREFDRDRLWTRAWFYNPRDWAQLPRLVWDLSSQERYNHPGNPVLRTLPSGHRAIQQHGDFIFLAGAGATPEGDRPFLDRFNTRTLTAERLFRCDAQSYEFVVALLSPDGTRLLTSHESATSPPNYFLRTSASDARQALTRYPDPAPQLRRIQKQLVRYKRADGVDLSFTLYLPPDYQPGERRPGVVWAYPVEFADASVAGQVSGSPNRFTLFSGASHLFFLLAGYVVLDGATMPVVGDPETVNNTYVQQIAMSAQAAVDKAAELGVLDPQRVGVGGHSYGAFMTANLLAHTDLFRAGIARSGAYNRTLTPFGFQNERRTLWQALDTYIRISPFMYANKINEPLLLIHGEADNNTGTFPIQSDRMYHAIKGNGGTVRYVSLPHESHGYLARESVEHVLWEMIHWFDRWVKHPPRPADRAAAQQ